MSIEERREDMIKLVSGAFQGTPASANRRREEYLEIQKRQEQNIQQAELLKNIWNIPYYRTLEEQNDFLINNADYRIVRDLAKTQERYAREFNNPLLIPKLTRQELTLMPLNKMLFLRMQGIEIGRNAEHEDDPAGKYGDYSAGFPARLSQFATQLQHEPTMKFLSMHGSLYKEYSGYPEKWGIADSVKTGVIGSGFDRKRGQIQQKEVTPIIAGTKPFEKPKRVSVFKTTVSKAPIEILPIAAAEPEPKPLPTKCYMVFGRKLELTQDAVNYYKNIGVKIEECKIDLDFNGVSTPVTTQGGEEILVKEPTEPAQLPAQALPIGFTGIIAALVVLGGLFSWRNK